MLEEAGTEAAAEQVVPHTSLFVLASFAISLSLHVEGLVESDAAEEEAARAHQELVARNSSCAWVERWAASLRDEAVAESCDDRKAAVYSQEDDHAVQYQHEVPVLDWLTDSNIPGAELEVDQAAVVAHFARDLVADVCVVGVGVVRKDYLGGCVGEQERALLALVNRRY